MPARARMPDHTQRAPGGHGETRSCALNFPSLPKVISRAYVRLSHDGLAKVPTSSVLGAAVGDADAT